jgi:hypothetical protein
VSEKESVKTNEQETKPQTSRGKKQRRHYKLLIEDKTAFASKFVI